MAELDVEKVYTMTDVDCYQRFWHQDGNIIIRNGRPYCESCYYPEGVPEEEPSIKNSDEESLKPSK